MKNNTNQPLFAEERKEQILKLLEEQSKIMVPDLCELFDVSPVTIRNDLRDLETEGRLRRTHGGAIPIRQTSFEPITSLKEAENLKEKQLIASYAAQFVSNGDTIAIDTGTTSMEFAKMITSKKNLTVVTNDLKIALYLESNSDANIIIVAGLIRRGFHCSTGPMSNNCLKDLNVDKAFLASNAFTIEKGFTTPSIDHAQVKKSLISIAAEVIMLLDNSKIGRIAFSKFAGVHDIDKLIVDKDTSTKVIDDIKELNDEIEIFVV